ncbi:hypothetical protein DYD83_00640 [Dickeya fangzhongdai]|uniref:Uncharacterized protein n=1 Tax=Dickeya fangzhongdai TaxID=1778540 RepID=A0A2K8QIP6_9GAMM|nr:hypothetical protein CVE23_00600 [Dickeya fangzhongdai]QOH46039.1 hypothetical protein DYD82_00630 [Dickeya fangzhongdai]QOH50347.1 hypothetical protein DYD83_00640 [Dickeya fangzhongdai]
MPPFCRPNYLGHIPVILQVAGVLAALLGPFHGPRPFGAAASSVQIGLRQFVTHPSHLLM